MRICRRNWLIALAFVALPISLTANVSARPQAQTSAEIPVAKGDAGACSADFVVSDSAGKGLYDSKITIQLKYGFMSLHKLDLTVGTNYEGKARIEGLPERIRGSADFKISQGNLSKSLPFDPLDNCHPKYEVTLGQK